MKSKMTKTLQIITGVATVGYFVYIANAFFQGELSFINLIDIYSFVLLLIFMAGFALSWTRQKMAGIILMVWNAGAWIWDLYLFRGQGEWGMASIMAVPVMVIGVLFLLQWYKTTKVTVPSKRQQWKFILRVLLINYAVLYAIVMFSELFHGEPVDYFSFSFIIDPLLLLIFIVGFLLSWKREFLAGYIFLFWYAILIYANFTYSEIRHSGPWIIFGIAILLQGIFYINQHYRYRPK